MKTFTCSQCGLTKITDTNGGTGYGLNAAGDKVCYACCAVNDSKALGTLKPKEKLLLYYNGKEVTNWPGSLRITPTGTRVGRHNIARTQTTVYFMHQGSQFTGRQYGNNSEILHVTKRVAVCLLLAFCLFLGACSQQAYMCPTYGKVVKSNYRGR